VLPLTNADPLLVLATVLVVGVAFGALAKRAGLPSITGQIVGGVLIGRAGFELFDHGAIAELHPLTAFALGLMAVTIGAHLNVRRLRNAGKRLFFLLLLESIVTPTLVFVGLVFLPDMTWSGALLFGTLAISTAPATIVAIVKEARAKGVFVKTLVAAVAFNNMACILLFELARSAVHVQTGASEYTTQQVLLEPTVQLLKAAILGGAGAAAMAAVMRLVDGPEKIATAAVVILLLTSGLASYLGVSAVLACLMLGLIQTNFTRSRDRILDAVFSDFEPAILAVFFTLAGMELSFDHILEVGLVAALVFSLRFTGKLLSADWAMRLAGATLRVRKNLGMALVPQAGVAVGLVVLLQEDAQFNQSGGAEMVSIFVAVVLTVVTANELVGPILTRLALQRSGEAGNDRMRLIDFIHEENILTDLHADSKEDAIAKLTNLLINSHHLRNVDGGELLQSVIERENHVSTCFGGGLFVPHGILPAGEHMVGVMGLSREGLAFDTPDGRAVHCVVLLATPESERDRHLQVLATLARTVGSDATFQAQLFDAKSPAHAYEILHDEEAESFNYFLED
jgi:Kef-type K+ transport system membrane component KefB/mannitol/fructose-specific phosphotransferase system IIA component (Ntr-type)